MEELSNKDITTLIIVRHAEAEGNIKREFHGWTDSPLTPKGHEQAKKVAERLRNIKIDVLYSSSLTRTLQTAQYISDIKGLNINKTEGLKEINAGDWEGIKFRDLPVLWPQDYETWDKFPHVHNMPNGESMDDLKIRMVEEIDKIIDANRGKTICIVSHGTAIKTVMCTYKCMWPDKLIDVPWFDNTAVSIVEVAGNDFSLVLEGDCSHLDNELCTIQNQEWFIELKNKKEAEK